MPLQSIQRFVLSCALLSLSSPAQAVPVLFENFQAVGYPGPNPGWTHSGQAPGLLGQGSTEDSLGGNQFVDISNNVTPGSGQSTFVGTGGPGSLPAFGAGTLTLSFDYAATLNNDAFLTLTGPGLAGSLSSGFLPATPGGFPLGFVNHVVASVVTAGSAGGGTYTFTFGGSNFGVAFDNILLDFQPAAGAPELNGACATLPFVCLALMALTTQEQRKRPLPSAR